MSFVARRRDRPSESVSSIVGVADSAGVRINPATLEGESVYVQLFGADETAAQSVTLDSKGHKLLEVYGCASASTTFHLDVSNDNVNWIADYKVYSAVTSVKETLWNGFRYVRFKSDAAGVAGDTVDLVLAAK
mgnify:CR=1 FL=1